MLLSQVNGLYSTWTSDIHPLDPKEGDIWAELNRPAKANVRQTCWLRGERDSEWLTLWKHEGFSAWCSCTGLSISRGPSTAVWGLEGRTRAGHNYKEPWQEVGMRSCSSLDLNYFLFLLWSLIVWFGHFSYSDVAGTTKHWRSDWNIMC